MTEQDEKKIQAAWEIWNVVNHLGDLLWQHYEEAFFEIYCREQEEKFLHTVGPVIEEKADS